MTNGEKFEEVFGFDIGYLTFEEIQEWYEETYEPSAKEDGE